METERERIEISKMGEVDKSSYLATSSRVAATCVRHFRNKNRLRRLASLWLVAQRA